MLIRVEPSTERGQVDGDMDGDGYGGYGHSDGGSAPSPRHRFPPPPPPPSAASASASASSFSSRISTMDGMDIQPRPRPLPQQRYPYPPSIQTSVSTSTSPSHSPDPYVTMSSTLDAFDGSISSYTASPTSIPPDQRLANQIAIAKQVATRYGNVSAVPFEEVESVLGTLRDTHAQLTLVAIGHYSEERSHLINTLDHLISRYQTKLPTIIPSPTSPMSHFQPSHSPRSHHSPRSNLRMIVEETKQSPPARPLYTSTFVPDASLTPDWDAWSINRWGELVKRGKDDSKPKKHNVELEQAREFKWVKMTRQWDKYSTRQRDTLKRRIRKGIPDSVRAMVWPLITGSYTAQQRQPGLYTKLILQHSVHEEQIGRDINRTFPNHVFIKEDSSSGSMGRESLTNVLKAYAVYDAELGYCQGMGFIVGIFLMYLSEEDAFWMLVTLLRGDRFFFNGFYSSGFPLLHQYFYQLTCMMKRHLPKLHTHLKKHQIEPSLYATQWFITLFSYNLSFDTLMRVWDILFHEGPKILFRVALALLKMNEKRLLAADMENIFITFREIESHPGSSDPDVLLTAAFKFGITRKEIESYAKEYQVIKLKEDQAKRKREEDRKAKSNGTMNGKH